MLWVFKINFRGFRRFLIHGNSSYVVLYTQCLRYNICSAWFLDIRIQLNCFYENLWKINLFMKFYVMKIWSHTVGVSTTKVQQNCHAEY